MNKQALIDLFNERGRNLKPQRRIFFAQYRQRLLQAATGKTLEVAVGAGANFAFYPPGVELTAVDFSPVLLEIAAAAAEVNQLNIQMLQSDVESLTFAVNSFDTIVSTLSLCAYDDPVKVLKNFNEWCKPEGKILLFEHGLSLHKPLNWLLNRLDAWNLKKNGDHLNLNVRQTLVESGITVEEMQTAVLGTHYLIVARPNK